nr:MAG TPA: Protein of unknown function (DUF5131) [Caudoviricetes sp.]
MTPTKIEWCDETWNPVTGCKHPCEYCYARRQAKRFGGYSSGGGITTFMPLKQAELSEPLVRSTKSGKTIKAPFPFGFLPTLHRYRLGEPTHKRKPRNIFVGSMTDLFGEWVPDKWIKAVFDACETSPQHNYLFLTKNPAGIEKAVDNYACEERGSEECYQFFNNFWFGTTITEQADIYRLNTLSELEEGHRFISIEPLLGPITLNFDKNRCPACGSKEVYEDNPMTTPEGIKTVYCDCCGEWESNSRNECVPDIDWVILGAETGNRKNKVKPERAWVESIVTACRTASIPVFMKDSLVAVWGGPLVREFPQGLRKEAQA